MVTVKKITSEEELQQAFAIRDIVFVQEQNCPADLEHEHDDIATHFLATWNDVPAGAARWRATAQGCKLERFAVLREFRGKGIAAALIGAVMADLPVQVGLIYLNSQVDAVPVYEKNGFVKVGELFEEAGIQHYRMEKR